MEGLSLNAIAKEVGMTGPPTTSLIFTVYARAALSDLRFGVFDLPDKRPLIKGT